MVDHFIEDIFYNIDIDAQMISCAINSKYKNEIRFFESMLSSGLANRKNIKALKIIDAGDINPENLIFHR